MNDHSDMSDGDLIDALIEAVAIVERYWLAPLGSPAGSKEHVEAERAKALILEYRIELLRRLES